MGSVITIRPICPESLIPIHELYEIIDECKGKIDAITFGGLCANDNIVKKLSLQNIKFLENSKSEYLIGVGKDFFDVDVRKEIAMLITYCKENDVPCFAHSLEALNYLKQKRDILGFK